MAKFFLLSLVLASFLLFVASSHAANKVVDVGELCKQAKNPSFCLALLNSNPSSDRKDDLATLAQTAIDVIRANVTNTITMLRLLIAKSSDADPNANNHYKICLEHFDEGVVGDINDTQETFKNGDYYAMNLAASSVIDEVDECVSGDPGDPPFSDPSLLPKYADVIMLVTNIILVITNNLISS